MRALALVTCLCLAACSGRPASELNPHTGVASRASSVVTVDRRYPARLDVRAVHMVKDGAEEFVLLTFVSRSDFDYPKIESVWSLGRALPYERTDRRRAGSRRLETGRVRLSRGVVTAAARRGMRFEMIGLRGSYGGTVPSRVFREALEPPGEN